MTRFHSITAVDASAERFRAIFARHHPAVYGYAARRVGRSDAGDVAAEVFTVAWRRLSRVPEEPDTLPWLYAVTHRVVLNLGRSGRRRERLAARMAGETAMAQAGADHVPAVLEALDGLGGPDREILRLAAWEGLGPDEIGSVLGCSPNAAAVRLHRARRRLAQAMEGEES